MEIPSWPNASWGSLQPNPDNLRVCEGCNASYCINGDPSGFWGCSALTKIHGDLGVSQIKEGLCEFCRPTGKYSLYER